MHSHFRGAHITPTARSRRCAGNDRDPSMPGLNTDFQFDTLRSDPRFAELVRKVALPQERDRRDSAQAPAALSARFYAAFASASLQK